MLARVARPEWETPAPNARGLLGKARPPRVSRGLRGGRQAYPTDGRQTFLHRAAAPEPGGDAPKGRGRVLDVPVAEGSPGGREALPPRRRAQAGSEWANPDPDGA